MGRIVFTRFGARIARSATLVAVAATCMGCNETTVCTAGSPAMRTVPADTTVSPGQSFTLLFEVGTPCASPGRWDTWDTLSVHWATSDTNIVQLDTSTGLVTARATGDASVFTPNSFGHATVHVR